MAMDTGSIHQEGNTMNLKSLSSKVAEKVKETGSAVVNTEFSDMSEAAKTKVAKGLTTAVVAVDAAQDKLANDKHNRLIVAVKDKVANRNDEFCDYDIQASEYDAGVEK